MMLGYFDAAGMAGAATDGSHQPQKGEKKAAISWGAIKCSGARGEVHTSSVSVLMCRDATAMLEVTQTSVKCKDTHRCHVTREETSGIAGSRRPSRTTRAGGA